MFEVHCKKCGKIFFPTPLHVYKNQMGIYCSWTCFNHSRVESKVHYRHVEQYTREGEYVTTFLSAAVAADFMGCPTNGIRTACKKNKIYKGYLWRYEDEVS